eukprot:GHVU01094655.1.p1 GENE.GHVU01094655.1~~GHVU01094655.1.p1  ORF type:complete len:269 (+),score=22.26 GHVU01094655.1:283-1089(+)
MHSNWLHKLLILLLCNLYCFLESTSLIRSSARRGAGDIVYLSTHSWDLGPRHERRYTCLRLTKAKPTPKPKATAKVKVVRGGKSPRGTAAPPLKKKSGKAKHTVEQAVPEREEQPQEQGPDTNEGPTDEELLRDAMDLPVQLEPLGSPASDVPPDVADGSRRVRFTIHFSNNHSYATIVDDKHRHILAAASTLSPDVAVKLKLRRKPLTGNYVIEGNTIEAAWYLGAEVARRALRKGVSKVHFDRAEYRYEGKTKAIAEGARKAGLIF